MDILGSLDGSGKYDILKRIEDNTSKEKCTSVKPADCHLTSDNEQVMAKCYRLFGSESERKLKVNVINNWNVSYFCEEENLNKPGIQQNRDQLPNWYCTLQKDKLEECKSLPDTVTKPLEDYINVTLENKINEKWNKEDQIESNMKRLPPKLSGVKRTKACQKCSNILPDSGRGSRTCLTCKASWTEKEDEDESLKPEKKKRTKENRSIEQRLKFYSPFMKPDLPINLKNVDHKHRPRPIVEQLPAMQGNPSSLENVRGHARQYGSFLHVPKYCRADPSYCILSD